jgi:hypothetical protein
VDAKIEADAREIAILTFPDYPCRVITLIPVYNTLNYSMKSLAF